MRGLARSKEEGGGGTNFRAKRTAMSLVLCLPRTQNSEVKSWSHDDLCAPRQNQSSSSYAPAREMLRSLCEIWHLISTVQQPVLLLFAY